MKNILELNKDLISYLDKSTQQMVSDLKSILSDKSIAYVSGKTKSDAVAYYFEYEYDYIDIVFWAVDKASEIITDTLILPTIKESKADEKSKWNAFMPEKIWNKVADFQDNYEDDNLYDLLAEYDKEKYEIFEKWFCNCWTQVTKETGNKMDAYFSIHDTIYKTDLNTLQEIKEEQIENRYR